VEELTSPTAIVGEAVKPGDEKHTEISGLEP